MSNQERKPSVQMIYPNQKLIVKFETVHDSDHIYFYQSKKALSDAMRNLSNSAFKIYMYLNSNGDYSTTGFINGLSYKAFHDFSGVGETAFHKGVKELIKKGYLVRDEKSFIGYNNVFFFYEDREDAQKYEKNAEKNESNDSDSSEETSENTDSYSSLGDFFATL